MAYNPYMYGGYYNPYQYNNAYQQQQPPQMQSQQAAQQLTPPTIHADIVQIVDIKAADNYPVGAGQSQMLMTQDDSAIIIKSVLANGQTVTTIYKRQNTEPQKPEINLSDYITRDEFERRLTEITTPAPAPTAPKRAAKKEADS